ncbi:MAG: hypothetical protein A2Y71_03955 [Bacteroidetes bacterium RBG_13_42_15]|nr:MAG: hypothetical protein A2Y71_03955 [Bacteroidetes bacterium RBG_13_42_15]
MKSPELLISRAKLAAKSGLKIAKCLFLKLKDAEAWNNLIFKIKAPGADSGGCYKVIVINGYLILQTTNRKSIPFR